MNKQQILDKLAGVQGEFNVGDIKRAKEGVLDIIDALSEEGYTLFGGRED